MISCTWTQNKTHTKKWTTKTKHTPIYRKIWKREDSPERFFHNNANSLLCHSGSTITNRYISVYKTLQNWHLCFRFQLFFAKRKKNQNEISKNRHRLIMDVRRFCRIRINNGIWRLWFWMHVNRSAESVESISRARRTHRKDTCQLRNRKLVMGLHWYATIYDLLTFTWMSTWAYAFITTINIAIIIHIKSAVWSKKEKISEWHQQQSKSNGEFFFSSSSNQSSRQMFVNVVHFSFSYSRFKPH